MTEGEITADDVVALGAAAAAPPMAVAVAAIAADEASALEAAWASRCGIRLQPEGERSQGAFCRVSVQSTGLMLPI